jgi:flagellar protein FlbD
MPGAPRAGAAGGIWITKDTVVIHLTRLNREDMIVNADLIEFIERTPDTILTLTTGKKLMVRESPDEIIELVLQFRERAGLRLAHPGMLITHPAKPDEEE